MTRPTLEVADILRAHGDRFLARYRSSFGFQKLKAFRAIQRCRTAALGGRMLLGKSSNERFRKNRLNRQ